MAKSYRITGGIVTEGPDGTLSGPIELSPLVMRKPARSLPLFESYNVCAHPNFDGVYEDPDVWVPKLVSLGAYAFRGMFASNLPKVQRTLELARQHGLKWLATVASLKTTEAQLRQRLDEIRADIARGNSPFLAIEGINEPDSDGLTDAEIAKVVKFQRIIWDYVKLHNLPLVVLSPALRRPAAPALYERFARARLLGTFDVVSLHHYGQAGKVDASELAEHIDMVQAIWECDRFWVTETGSTNATASTDPRRCTEAVSAAHAVRNALVILSDLRVEKLFRYELFDDDESLADNEAHFGLFRADGSPKPEVARMMEFIDSVWDDDPSYDPDEVILDVVAPAGVEQLLVSSSVNGATLWLWRPDAAHDAAPVPVRVSDALGDRVIQVGGTAVPLSPA